MKNHKITIGRIILCLVMPIFVVVLAVVFIPILMYICFRKELVLNDGKYMELKPKEENSSQKQDRSEEQIKPEAKDCKSKVWFNRK